LERFVESTRQPEERRGDLRAQLAAHQLAERRLDELSERRGRDRVAAAMDELYSYSERMVRAAIADLGLVEVPVPPPVVPAGELESARWTVEEETASKAEATTTAELASRPPVCSGARGARAAADAAVPRRRPRPGTPPVPLQPCLWDGGERAG